MTKFASKMSLRNYQPIKEGNMEIDVVESLPTYGAEALTLTETFARKSQRPNAI